jgi:hypothetical protein
VYGLATIRQQLASAHVLVSKVAAEL